MKTTLIVRNCLACAIALAVAVPIYAQENKPGQPGERQPEKTENRAYNDNKSPTTSQPKEGVPSQVNKARCLIGMKVCNQQDEKLGRIKDIVVDLQSGCVAYVVLSVGSPFRSKFVAVPPSAFTSRPDENYLILNADKNRLLSATGFDKRNWPNMATPSWGAEPFLQTPPEKATERDYEKNESDKNAPPESDKTPTTPLDSDKDKNPTPDK